jgi:hypothetical protein
VSGASSNGFSMMPLLRSPSIDSRISLIMSSVVLIRPFLSAPGQRPPG